MEAIAHAIKPGAIVLSMSMDFVATEPRGAEMV